MAARCRPWPTRTCTRTGAPVAPDAWRRWPGSRAEHAPVRARAGAGLCHSGSAGTGAARRCVAVPLRGAVADRARTALAGAAAGRLGAVAEGGRGTADRSGVQCTRAWRTLGAPVRPLADGVAVVGARGPSA
ncbi:hypothetical protein G6F24_015665 [Rhizopus arrhizus]|nr:hypothetical protein G6F24_015665 [Rhizopus arrhizus]